MLKLLQDRASTLENSFQITMSLPSFYLPLPSPSQTQLKLLPASQHPHLARGPGSSFQVRDRKRAQEEPRPPSPSRMGLLRCRTRTTHTARTLSTKSVCSHQYFMSLNLWQEFLQLEYLVPNHIPLEWHLKSLHSNSSLTKHPEKTILYPLLSS